MTDRIAIKKLTASDCTLFKAVFKTINAGNQKSINLNADILLGQLYPDLVAVAAETNNEVAVAISIYGPGAKNIHKVARKIIKNATYKNWRLNGEYISGPDDDISRYDGILPDDLAVMIFRGEAAPSSMDLIIVSQGNSIDGTLYTGLATLFGNKSMIAVTPAQIAAITDNVAVLETHPIYIAAADPAMDAALEDAAQSGFEGTGKLLKNTKGRKVSSSDLAKAKARAELTGQEGEGLVNGYLAAQVAAGLIASYKWTSAENAIAPFDFDTMMVSGQRTLIDAKATRGAFENVIHLSLAEVIEASSGIPYRIYRVFEIDADGGNMCISEDIHPLAQHLKTIHEINMPQGIRIDSFSIATATLKWGPKEYVERPDGEDVS